MGRVPVPPDGKLLEWAAAAGLPEEVATPLLLPAIAAACRSCGVRDRAAEDALRALAKAEPNLSRGIWLLGALGAVDPKRCLPEEFRAARKVRAALRKYPHEKRAEAARRGRARSRTPAAVTLLLAEAQEVVRSDVKEALGWLDAASELVPLLSAAGYAEPVVAALGVRVAAHRANAVRVSGDIPEADRRFCALRHDPRCRQVFDPAVHAELASLEASLRQSQRRLPYALRLLARAQAGFRAVNNSEGLARTLVQEGIVLDLAGEPAKSVMAYRGALKVMNRRASPSFALMVRLNLALALCGLKDYAGAAAAVAATRLINEQFPVPWYQLRLTWVEGRVARGLGKGDAAEGHLRKALQMCLDDRNGFNAALVGMDLAELYLEQGRTGAVKDLSLQLAAAFRLRGVHREMVKALRLFQRAAAAEQVTAALVEALRDYLRRAEHDSALAFRAGA